MTSPAERVVAALLDGDLPALRALLADPAVADVARAGLARLAPDDGTLPGDETLPDDAVALLRTVSGHPGLAAAELRALVGDRVWATAPLLLERELVSSRRFDRADCWSRTAAGAALLRSL